MQLSYSQNLEDYHLSLAFAGKQTGYYIDVGGGHPVADNVSFWFYERGWQGLVVEPQPELVGLYRHLRPRDVSVCGLVGRHDGEMDFHVVDRLHGFSTTRVQHAHRAKAFGVEYRTVRAPVTTLARLCERYQVGEVDFLKVDVEGAEADVLLGNDWSRCRPKVVVVEAVQPMSGEPVWHDWEPFLIAQGYEFRLFDTLNRFYVAREHQNILAQLPSERAPWDSARHMYEVGRAPESTQHPDHVLAQDLALGFWASLPYLDRTLIADLLVRARKLSRANDIEGLTATIDSDAFRAALGRIACGYDGGQIITEK